MDGFPNEIKLSEASYSSLLRKLPHSKISPPADQATHALDHERSSHSNQSKIRLEWLDMELERFCGCLKTLN